MRGRSRTILRSLAVAAVAVSPLAALQADAAINTGAASASGPGISVENTGGNVTYGTGHSESKVVTGNPSDVAPLATPNALTAKGAAPTVDPGASARARAQAIVAAARLRAQAQIDAARAAAEAAVQHAEEQANQARANSQQQSQDARTRAESNSASASSSSSN